MKNLLLMLVLLLCQSVARAEEYEALFVHCKGEQVFKFRLDDEPKVTFDELSIKVESSKESREYLKDEVLKFTYGTVSSIEEIKTDTTPFIQQGDKLQFKNVIEGCLVVIYNVNGSMIHSPITMTDNQFEISIADLSAGVYIVKVDTQSYKIIKR